VCCCAGRHGACAALLTALATPAADAPVASPQSLTPWGCEDATCDAAWPQVADAVSEATDVPEHVPSLVPCLPTPVCAKIQKNAYLRGL
jgi:hypothetical protein